MKAEYDLHNEVSAQSLRRKTQETRGLDLRLEEDVIEYFETLAEETGVPYQNLMSLYLRDCVASHRTLKFEWN